MFVMEHILESLLYKDTLLILNHLHDNKEDSPIFKDIKKMAQKYYKKLMITAKNINGILLYNNAMSSPVVIIEKTAREKQYDGTQVSEWQLAEKEDEEDLKVALGKIANAILPMQDKCGTYVGFMSLIKNQYYIFKVKHTMKLRHKGARCDQSGKKDATNILQNILAQDGIDIDVLPLQQTQICILQEFYLRLYNIEREKGKKWFLTPTEVLIAIH